MTALEKYQIIENLVPVLTQEDWKMLVYHFEESHGFSILRDIIKYMATRKKEQLTKVWPLGSQELNDCVAGSPKNHYMSLTQEDVDALLRGLSGEQ